MIRSSTRSRSRRVASLGVSAVGVAAVCAIPSSALAARASAVPAGAATVSRGTCTTSPSDATGRAASFSVRVRSLSDAPAYGFSARLQEKRPGGRWTTLKGSAVPAGFGAFQTARTGSPRMTRRIDVQGLAPGSSYRLRVSARWTGTSKRSVTRTSRSCTVKDVRPDIGLTGSFGWQPSTAGGEVAYRIGLRTDGYDALAGRDVGVVVRQGTTVLATGTYRPTASGLDVLLLAGRRCLQGPPVEIRLDPDDELDDRNAENDVLMAPCVPVP